MDNDDSTSKPSGPPRRGRPPKGDRARTAPASAGVSPSPDAIAVETRRPRSQASGAGDAAAEAVPAPAPNRIRIRIRIRRPTRTGVPTRTGARDASPVRRGGSERRSDRLDLAALKEMGIASWPRSRSPGDPGRRHMKKQELVFQILAPRRRRKGSFLRRRAGDLPDGFGFLRAPNTATAGPDDIYVSPSQIRKFDLRTGDTISDRSVRPRTTSATSPSSRWTPSTSSRRPLEGEDLLRNLTPLYPRRIGWRRCRRTSPRACSTSWTRWAKGSAPSSWPRPARARRCSCRPSQRHHHQPSEIVLIVLLIDERPEEVTDMQGPCTAR